MTPDMPDNLNPELRDQYLVSTDYITFLGIIIAGAFTVLAILLAFSDLLELHNFGYLFYSILLLVVSIFLSFESLGGFVWYKRTVILEREDIFYYHYGNTFWYGGIFTFLLSIIYLLLNVGVYLIALIAYLLLFFFSVIDWVDDFFSMNSDFSNYIVKRRAIISEIENNMERDFSRGNVERTEEEIRRNNNRIIRSHRIRICKTWIFRIALYISVIAVFMLYYGWLGSDIIWNLIQNIEFFALIMILFYMIYFLIWGIKFYFRLRT
ncbi:hypothetical protein ES703_10437 [subsurface metagenome]